MLEGLCETLKTIERRATLTAFDKIKEIEGERSLFRKLFLRQALCLSDLAQPRAELPAKSAHLSESSQSTSCRTPTQSVCISFTHTLSMW